MWVRVRKDRDKFLAFPSTARPRDVLDVGVVTIRDPHLYRRRTRRSRSRAGKRVERVPYNERHLENDDGYVRTISTTGAYFKWALRADGVRFTMHSCTDRTPEFVAGDPGSQDTLSYWAVFRRGMGRKFDSGPFGSIAHFWAGTRHLLTGKSPGETAEATQSNKCTPFPLTTPYIHL